MKNRVFVDVTVRRKAPVEVVFLAAVICGLSFVVDWQFRKILELKKEVENGTIY